MSKNWLARRVRGSKFSKEALDAGVLLLAGIRDSSYHHGAKNGHGGWYRRLADKTRIGYVATSQMAIFASSQGATDVDFSACVKFLLEGQRDDGGWSFVTNAGSRSVVDSTAWAIMSLVSMQSSISAAAESEEIRDAIANGEVYLRLAEREDGGWGINESSDWRALSTALAMRAMLSAGCESSDLSLLAAARSLVSHIEPNTGSWLDSQGKTSIAATSAAIVALSELDEKGNKFGTRVRKAQKWLISTCGSDSWGEKSDQTAHEEVDFLNEVGQRVRIEYHYSPRPLAVVALSAGRLNPEVLYALLAMLSADEHSPRDWVGSAQSDWTSWMVFDSWNALRQVDLQLPKGWREVWWTPSRVVVSLQNENWLAMCVRRYWPQVIVLLLSAGIIWAVSAGGLVEGTWFKTLAFVIATILLSVVSNAISAVILDGKRGK